MTDVHNRITPCLFLKSVDSIREHVCVWSAVIGLSLSFYRVIPDDFAQNLGASIFQKQYVDPLAQCMEGIAFAPLYSASSNTYLIPFCFHAREQVSSSIAPNIVHSVLSSLSSQIATLSKLIMAPTTTSALVWGPSAGCVKDVGGVCRLFNPVLPIKWAGSPKEDTVDAVDTTFALPSHDLEKRKENFLFAIEIAILAVFGTLAVAAIAGVTIASVALAKQNKITQQLQEGRQKSGRALSARSLKEVREMHVTAEDLKAITEATFDRMYGMRGSTEGDEAMQKQKAEAVEAAEALMNNALTSAML